MRYNMENYEETYKNFRWEIPEYYNFAYEVMDEWAKKEPNRLALITVHPDGKTNEKHTFWELSRLTNKFANLLSHAGGQKGDRILVLLPQIPEFYVAVLGAIKKGIVFMPTPTLSTSKDLEYRLNISNAKFAITDAENAYKIDEIKFKCPNLRTLFVVGGKKDGWISYDEEIEKMSSEIEEKVDIRSDEPLVIFFTSGTVGYPKMVEHSHAYSLAHLLTAKFVQDLKSNDIHWTIADTGWSKTAYGKLFGQWIIGCPVLQHNQKGKFNPLLTLYILENYGVTTFCAPPTVYRMLILEDLKKYKFSLRLCTSAGEPLNPEVIRAWEKGTGLKILDFYGQTETIPLIANFSCLKIKEGSMGKPMPGYYIAIVDDEGNELPPGEEGHIAVKVKPFHPPGIFKGYLNQPETNQIVFRGDWYYTGDRGYKDKDGYFWFVGRADDVIKASGYRIGPFEVESALIEHPSVQEAAVIGKPDPIRGEIVKAFVILKPGFQPSEKLVEELQVHVKKVTAPYKYPREIEFVKDLPKTLSGKIRRGELRKIELERLKVQKEKSQ